MGEKWTNGVRVRTCVKQKAAVVAAELLLLECSQARRLLRLRIVNLKAGRGPIGGRRGVPFLGILFKPANQKRLIKMTNSHRFLLGLTLLLGLLKLHDGL